MTSNGISLSFVFDCLLWSVVILSAIWWTIQLVAMWRVRQGVLRLDAPDFKTATENEKDFPSISIIVPARNEERYVEAALKGKLNANYPNIEVVFVDDRSNDRTGEIADALAKTDHRLSVIHLRYLPSGWLGKIYALHKGILAAKGDWLLFTDADVHLDGDLLKRAMSLAKDEKLDHITAVPGLIPKSGPMTAVLAGFIRALMVFTRSWAASDLHSTAFFGCGAFNLVKRTALNNTPGLQYLKMEISDDAALGAMLKAHGARQKAVLLGNLSRLEYYPNLKGLFTGLEKNGAMIPFGFYPFIVAALLSVELGYLAGLLQYATPSLFITSALVYLIAAATQLSASVAWGCPLWTALLPGWGVILFSLAFLRSGFLAAVRGGVRWRDTFYLTQDVRNGAVLQQLVKQIKTRVKAMDTRPYTTTTAIPFEDSSDGPAAPNP